MTNPLSFYLFTYNLNKGKVNGPNFVNKLVETFPDEPVTAYAFGVQEFCGIMDGCFSTTANQLMLSLNELFLQALVAKYSDTVFKTVCLVHSGAVGLILITPCASKFASVRTADVGVGYLYSSMKGAVGVRVSLQGCGEATFVCAHLPAFEGPHYYVKRNNAAASILRALDFGDGYGFWKPNSHGFFMGDLNYRTTKHFDTGSPVLHELLGLGEQSTDYTGALIKYDELTKGMAAGDVFPGFSEGTIDFRPTYKYHVDTAIYKNTRSPSWCDRILFQNTYTSTTSVISNKSCVSLPKVVRYSSIDTLLDSDHRPVFLHIQVPATPPESMVSRNGYLQIIPTQSQALHNHTDSMRNVLEAFNDYDESNLGPTQVYIRPTKVDFVVQRVIRALSDLVVGYGLYLGTTKRGRLLCLVVLVGLEVVRRFAQ